MEKKSPAIDLSHHLSELAKARGISPLKGLFKYIEKNPGIINMAGGVPSPEYFPFANLQADTLQTTAFTTAAHTSSPFSWLWNLFGIAQNEPKTNHILVPKYPKDPQDINLAVALQYGTATGIEPLRRFIHDFTELVYQPGYSDYTVLVHTGNTDGWNKAALALLNRGEGFLTEEWTYPSAIAGTKPFGFTPVSVKADVQGMRSDDLEQVLSNWDEASRGMKRPHVMYTVPCGQNPTGSNMGGDRKKEIYDICVKYDVIIVEDDPYYFLQEGIYYPKHLRRGQDVSLSEDDANKRFLSSLAPSYLKYDYQGRVIRLDTFSKTIAPGSRLGWFTCNAVFAERIERQAESTTQAPCGFGQSLVGKLLTGWTLPGYIRWLRGLQAEYTRRRDTLLDLFAEEFHLESSPGQGFWEGETVYTAYPRRRGRSYGTVEKAKPLLTFVPPAAGMFVWLRAHLDSLPGLDKKKDEEDPDTAEGRLWVRLAEGGILVGPGYLFAAQSTDERLTSQAHFRISFSSANHETMKGAVNTFATVLASLQKA